MIFLWLAVTGMHWDVVQVFAWGRMWTRNIAVENLAEAISSTFAPERMCELCKVVRDAKQSAERASMDFEKPAERAPLLPFDPGKVVVGPPVCVVDFLGEAGCPCSLGREMPPVPPPRSGASLV